MGEEVVTNPQIMEKKIDLPISSYTEIEESLLNNISIKDLILNKDSVK